MSKVMIIEVGDKEYKLGFPNRMAVKNAEAKGMNIIEGADKLVTAMDKIFYGGLLAYQPDMKEEEALKVLEQYLAEDGYIDEIIPFLTEQYMAFLKSPDGKKKKKAKIVEM